MPVQASKPVIKRLKVFIISEWMFVSSKVNRILSKHSTSSGFSSKEGSLNCQVPSWGRRWAIRRHQGARQGVNRVCGLEQFLWLQLFSADCHSTDCHFCQNFGKCFNNSVLNFFIELYVWNISFFRFLTKVERICAILGHLEQTIRTIDMVIDMEKIFNLIECYSWWLVKYLLYIDKKWLQYTFCTLYFF